MSTTMRSTIATTAGLTLLGAGLAVPAQAAVPDACADQGPSCSTVSRADVDGDGARDSVAQTRWASGDVINVTTRVMTAAGEKMHVVTRDVQTSRKPFRGAAGIDGEDGHEVVVETALGAHSAYYQVLTYRDGELKTLKDPRNRYRWVTDGSSWSDFGYQRTTTGTGGFKLVTREAVDHDRDGDFRQLTISSGWSESQQTWKRMGRTTRDGVSAATAHQFTGWHVPYLSTGI